LRETQMGTRGKRFIGRDTTGTPTLATTPSIEDTIAAANLARVYSDAMRAITERQKGVRTPYTGGGISLTDAGAVSRPIQESFEGIRFMGGPTDAQMTNIDWMLREGAGASVRDKRADWRKEVWGDTWNEDTGRWEKGDRTAALETQAGLLDQPVPDIYGTDYSKYITSGGGGGVGGVGGGGHYYARPYSIPRMQTGAGWEGLGAEYQPGTVEGLGLIAGKAYAPYEPLRTGLLNARPEFMGTPAGFKPMDFSGGHTFSDDDSSTTTTNSVTPTWGWTWTADPAGTTTNFAGDKGNWTWTQTG